VIANHVAQSRTGKEQSGVKMGSAAGRRSRWELLKLRDASGQARSRGWRTETRGCGPNGGRQRSAHVAGLNKAVRSE
jgi:hypothetical protein